MRSDRFLPLKKAEIMQRQFNSPTVQFCVEVRVPNGGEVVDRFTIEQVEALGKKTKNDSPSYDVVQRHLDDLSFRNELDYEIVRWGDPADRSEWIAGGSFND